MSERRSTTTSSPLKPHRENKLRSKGSRRGGATMAQDLKPVANSPKAEPSSVGNSVGRSPSNYALFESIHHRRYRQALLLVEAGIDVNSRNERGQTPLTYTSTHVEDAKSRSKFTRLFLGAGADPNIPDWQGLTVLMQAAIQGQTEMIRPLLSNAKTDPNFRDPEGNTALMFAASVGNVDVISIFLSSFRHENRAHYVGLRNNHGLTALQMASRNHHETCVRILTREAHQFPSAMDEFPEPKDLERAPTPSFAEGDDGKAKDKENKTKSRRTPTCGSGQISSRRTENKEVNKNIKPKQRKTSSRLETEKKNSSTAVTERKNPVMKKEKPNKTGKGEDVCEAKSRSNDNDPPFVPENGIQNEDIANDNLQSKIDDSNNVKGTNGQYQVNGIHQHQELYKNGRSLYKEMQKYANASDIRSSHKKAGKQATRSKNGSISSSPALKSFERQLLQSGITDPLEISWYPSVYGYERSPLRPSKSLSPLNAEEFIQNNFIDNLDSETIASLISGEKKRGRQDLLTRSSSESRGYVPSGNADIVDENIFNSTVMLRSLRSSWERETASWLSDSKDYRASSTSGSIDNIGKFLPYSRDEIPLPPIPPYGIPSKLDSSISKYIDCDIDLSHEAFQRSPLKKRNVAIKQQAC